MMFPTASALLADELGAPEAAAYDLLAGCTGFVYALAQAYGMIATGLAERALVVGGDVLSRILDWTDRSTLILFGDGCGAVVLERVDGSGGRIKLAGEIWSARSLDAGSAYEVGQEVDVVEIEGATAIVI
jgi:3-oxoacyl-[acyl-carrier-protein] synthase III